jgi:hypothetical protein
MQAKPPANGAIFVFIRIAAIIAVIAIAFHPILRWRR